jgi:putative transmembrane protein PGPGW
VDETRGVPSQRTQQLPRTVVVRSTRRVGVAILGGFFIACGLAAAVLPVIPGAIPLAFLGLTILSWEFQWAKRARFQLKRRWKQFKAKRSKRP